MTITMEAVSQTGRDPRELIPTWAFGLLVEDFRKKHHTSHDYTERVVGQHLVFLKAAGRIRRNARSDPAAYVRIVPTPPVDEAWHLSLQRTEVYLPMSWLFAGSFMHHRPVMDDDIRSGTALARTIPKLHETGYFVVPEFWEGEAGSSCCPPECNDQDGFTSNPLGSWGDLLPDGPFAISF
ncbi:hypothetical protein ABZ801_17800 [Actinomadura sp. NPDC047616]|uniref:hypothetical protein n=1 Tax=Actinomadura sp. NPDC047616 TaxID=3155914 RepID=UPI0033EF2BA2